MKNRILVIGSTGQLGSKLLQCCYKNDIAVDAIVCFQNLKKILKQKNKFKINNHFCLNSTYDQNLFDEYIDKNKIKLIYFLDYGSDSLEYFEKINSINSNSIFAIANKEMIIAGGSVLINKINLKKNIFIPLDSEHFSLFHSNTQNNHISKIYITASGGPFYFKKKINFKKVSFNEVINHPKWKMGISNSIDSSNFINKVLEIFEVSIIYNVDINKIHFLVSKEAFIHSIILYKDKTISINCFDNDMIIPLSKPLTYLFKKEIKINKVNSSKIFDFSNFNIETFNDKRFKIKKYLNYFKNLNHVQRIKFMLLNNYSHTLYSANKLKYNNIVDYIYNHLRKDSSDLKFKNIKDIVNFIKKFKSKNEIFN